MKRGIVALISGWMILNFQSGALAAPSLKLADWEKRPKLVVVLVIDQFRADYLTKLSSQFLPAEKNGKLGGFRYLMEKGAYFPFAQYPTFQCMTCPGHAMLLTGAPPAATGIVMNEWVDVTKGHKVYCAEDDQGVASPEKLRTSTVGDELKLVSPQSTLVSLALKDRAAIMLAGHKADAVLWFDKKASQWKTSAYYADHLPSWVETVNRELLSRKGQPFVFRGEGFQYTTTVLSPESLSYPLGTEMTFTLAKAAVHGAKLGQHAVPDILTISLSNHDFLGHDKGFGSAEIEALTLAEDLGLSDFLTDLKHQLGSLKEVVFVLSADHGIAPNVENAKKQGLAAEKVDLDAVIQVLEDATVKQFGKASQKYWADKIYFHFYLNPAALKEKNLNPAAVLEVGARALQGYSGLETVFTRTQFEQSQFPQGLLGQQLKAQYIPGISGDLVFVPRPFVMDKDSNHVTHITGYSYDREVPLILVGGGVRPGVYPESVDILRLAPTLSFLLGTVAPASSAGEILPSF